MFWLLIVTDWLLCGRLEHDLETRNNAIENLMNELTTLKHAASQHAKHGGHNDDLADLLGVHSSSSSASSQAMLSAAAAVTSSTMSNQQMVSILQSQRDRYKDKCTTVEANVLKLQEQVDNLQHHIKTLESDNLMLYSKIKFLQMYQTKKLQSHDAYVSAFSSLPWNRLTLSCYS